MCEKEMTFNKKYPPPPYSENNAFVFVFVLLVFILFKTVVD